MPKIGIKEIYFLPTGILKVHFINIRCFVTNLDNDNNFHIE
ncbi:uncharacterized protein METZ01_LOCUS229752 [marine metagenome]|uniref:Uncharacterized protein n=1 Tax=marine metagenome TaxID=408172 RepID=A0A382GP49_9ZZZZ